MSVWPIKTFGSLEKLGEGNDVVLYFQDEADTVAKILVFATEEMVRKFYDLMLKEITGDTSLVKSQRNFLKDMMKRLMACVCCGTIEDEKMLRSSVEHELRLFGSIDTQAIQTIQSKVIYEFKFAKE